MHYATTKTYKNNHNNICYCWLVAAFVGPSPHITHPPHTHMYGGEQMSLFLDQALKAQLHRLLKNVVYKIHNCGFKQGRQLLIFFTNLQRAETNKTFSLSYGLIRFPSVMTPLVDEKILIRFLRNESLKFPVHDLFSCCLCD